MGGGLRDSPEVQHPGLQSDLLHDVYLVVCWKKWQSRGHSAQYCYLACAAVSSELTDTQFTLIDLKQDVLGKSEQLQDLCTGQY